MAKLRKLAQSIQTGAFKVEPERSKYWVEIEQMIEQMTSTDFAITYGKDTISRDIPLFNIMEYHLSYLAEMMIRKNPVFAAKIVDNNGWTVLHHACSKLLPDEAVKIINLVLPYMSQEAILMHGINNDTFLHKAVGRNLYEVAAYIPPEVISMIIKKSAAVALPSPQNKFPYVSIIKFLKEAMQIYDIEIILFPKEPDNYFKKGVILQGMGKTEKFIKYYKKAIELDPGYIEKVKKVDSIKIIEESPNHKVNPNLLKHKIDALTKEISELNEKKLLLTMELSTLSSHQQVVEEHKGERVDEVPPYREEDALDHSEVFTEATALTGVSCDVTFHA